MDWYGIGVIDDVLGWLRRADEARYVGERRIDPFSTSMRDLDDVPDALARLQADRELETRDPTQRLRDLRFTGLVEQQQGKQRLTTFGDKVLAEWRKWKVDADSAREFERVLILYGIARRDAVLPYGDYWSYWHELRNAFDPIELIDNWDSLVTLNYMDFSSDGFAPGNAFRDAHTEVLDISYDLDLLFSGLSDEDPLRRGAEKVGRQVASQISRARSRPRAVLAMELLLRTEAERAGILRRFGEPGRVRQWKSLSDARLADVLSIAKSFDVKGAVAGDAPAVRDFSDAVLAQAAQAIPVRRRPTTTGLKRAPRRIDHERKQERNSEIGRLGEEFALQYEKWRLSSKPELREQIKQVSLEDDGAGYDISSFEPNGSKRLVEVKTTEGPLSTRFFMSSNEHACAEANRDSYVLLRVANIRSNPTCCELRPPFGGITFRASVFECTFDMVEEESEGETEK